MNYLFKLLALTISLCLANVAVCQPRAYKAPEFAKNWGKAGEHPDHIVLNFSGDPSSSAAVTWRTIVDKKEGYAEIALATAAPKFWRNAKTYKASTQTLDAMDVTDAQSVANYHSVVFDDLLADTLYAYRVGDGDIWSEWFQFRTASASPKPFSFLYVGDAQNYILELWSRLIREGYRKAPDASFIIHAGDLVNNPHHERQWEEWFVAGGWIHSMLPSLSTPGNHEYGSRNEADREANTRALSVQWRPQFTLPENGPAGYEELKETAYYIDYQGTRIISLNSNILQSEQIPWLEEVLSNNPNKWTIVTYHHPLFSASDGRDNERLRKIWKPIFDKYKVDLALQGHDHSYARGRTMPVAESNMLSGLNIRDYTGTAYVVSVSGGKMYNLRPNGWEGWDAEQDRAGENTQLFQVINVSNDTLSFQAFTATGQLYDAFQLIKSGDGKPNRFVEMKDDAIAERRFANTIPYEDQLPLDIQSSLLKKYKGYTVSRVTFFDNKGDRGYNVQLKKGGDEIGLTLSETGEVLKEEKASR